MDASKIAVAGAGTWGTVVANLLAAGSEGGEGPVVHLVPRRRELAEQIDQVRRNDAYLPGYQLSPRLQVTANLEDAVDGAGAVVLAVPSRWARPVLAAVAPLCRPGVLVLSLVKGLEEGSLLTMASVVAGIVPGAVPAVLSGPNLATEIAAGLPAATVVACAEQRCALYVQELLASPVLRVYTNDDVTGCEVAGAVKNVLALAAGMADGLDAGDNARAALITRGLAEMVRLGVAMGGHPLTFSGLAGLGDLVLTCTSGHSRNRAVGLRLGRGEPLPDVVASTPQVAEGVHSAAPVVALAARHGVELPICQQVLEVLEGRCSPEEALGALLGRRPTHELAGAPAWRPW